MPVKINITDNDIAYAESILLPSGKRFDDERKIFIKNFDTVDLQAVPGSGKTTALLAKLLILERYLPFKDGSGILVISHTNSAMDEITNKIGGYCPKLFSYPNFVGTIQSFVDNFLAIPCYTNLYKKQLYRIDNEIYIEKTEKLYPLPIQGFQLQEQKNARYYLEANECKLTYRLKYKNGDFKLMDSIDGKELTISKPKRGSNWINWTDNEKARVFEWLKLFKLRIIKDEGVLHFDDAYLLSDVFLQRFPRAGILLSKRFQLVFVDEMQDMDKHQHDLLEEIFHNSRKSSSIYQRIGDKNQAIFNGSAKLDEVWSPRDNVLNLNGSHRLTKPIAELVNCFALHKDEGRQIIGLREGNIKPHLIVYENNSIENVIQKFAEIVNSLIEKGEIKNENPTFKAIGWRKDDPDENKICLKRYCKTFEPEKHVSKIDYICLKNYLFTQNDSGKTFRSVRNNIINALIKILRDENVKEEGTGRNFTKQSLLKHLREVDPVAYQALMLYIYQWSLAIIQGKAEICFQKMKEYVPDLLRHFGKTIQRSEGFINQHQDNLIPAVDKMILTNRFKPDGVNFEIEIATIHSVKGQDHTGTLYLETYYQHDGNGENAKSYESQRLCNQLKLSYLTGNEGVRVKQSAKMMYVGFSRPTHLLCLAVHKDRFDRYLNDIDTNKWEIKTV